MGVQLESNYDVSQIHYAISYMVLSRVHKSDSEVMLITEIVDTVYTYLDLELDTEENLYRIGLVAPDLAENFSHEDLTEADQQLTQLRSEGLTLCGHNFRRFDYPHLVRQRPELQPWSIVDTLELSVLAFPLQPSHKLNKEYKQSQYAGNDPLEDALATKLLLKQILVEFSNKPQGLLQTYAWLLSCGTEEADAAYKQLFNLIGFEAESPALEDLPELVIAGLNEAYLQKFWGSVDTYDFDSRLILAAVIAWNYECNVTQSTRVFSNWLTHLPGFQQILNDLRPLKPQGFTYQPYLKRFDVPAFRGPQEEAVRAVLDGDRPLVLMATGSGKSLCYQLPALMLFEQQRALTVVVSPLQALMADQVVDLDSKGFDFATFINGNLEAFERSQRLEQIREGSKGLLYISPEQLRSPGIRALLQERPPALWVIDEAHCVSQWGHDFRPDYRYIPKFIQELYRERQLPSPLMALLTATATVQVRDDIKQLFAGHGLEIGREIISSGVRKNLEYEVIPTNGNKEQVLLHQVQHSLSQGGCTIVYTTTRKNAQRLADLFTRANIQARYYHGKLNKAEKDEVLQAFKARELNVVVATCAFGMGINRPDVRAVIHHTMSANLEGYIQEAGRAGRDDQPATCTLLFDLKDADTIFFLQSLNQLSEVELRNIFISTRNLRDRIHGTKDGISEDWFWVTANEIFQTSDLTGEFGEEQDQRDTKIKVALHYLEDFGMLERAENLSTFIKFELVHKTYQESYRQLEKYAQAKNLPNWQVEQFQRLIYAMHRAKLDRDDCDEPSPLDSLSDESGIGTHELVSRIRELQQADVCTFEVPLTILVTRGGKGAARTNHDRLCALEKELLEELVHIQGESGTVQRNLCGLASRLDPDRSKKVCAAMLLNILEGWRAAKWVRLSKVGRDVVQLEGGLEAVIENLEQRQVLAGAVIEVLYEKLGKKTGARLGIECGLEQLLKDVIQRTKPLTWSEKRLEFVLLWLHQRKLLRLTRGLSFLQQTLKVRVIKGKSLNTVTGRYPKIKERYDEQTRRIHTMVKYGKTSDPTLRQELIADYFGNEAHSKPTEEEKRPLTQEDYNIIMGPLNSAQTEIVLAENPALAVIAGPGSGKTRTIVHRIAYLVKVKRVEPSRIVVLAYNRNAVQELRSRLRGLVGPLASRLRVFTFHGLALALLGRTLGEQKRSREVDFTELLQEACTLLEQGQDELDDLDTQTRLIQLLGNIEHVFVDEYQDVAKDEYRLIQLISGLGKSEDDSRSVQTNLCVIGDDDQNIYHFKGTSPEYILQFETEYRAKKLLLTENYRSTQPIIEAANNLIRNNRFRCKRSPLEQVCIDSERRGNGGLPVRAFTFNNPTSQAAWVKKTIQSWVDKGVPKREIAVLARQWDTLSPVRSLLEREGIATYALKRDGIKLVRNRAACQLIEELKGRSHEVLPPERSVKDWFTSLLTDWKRSLEEPTVKILIEIASNLDDERGWGSEELAVPMSADEILTALFEFNETGEVFLQENAVLVTSCHGAKGLEFRKVILLTDGFNTASHEIESERRLFYVAMTRAKEELMMCGVKPCSFVQETDVSSQMIPQSDQHLPQKMFYIDLTPADVNLGYFATKNQQSVIKALHEGAPLQMKINQYGDGWVIQTQQGQDIGALSRRANQTLSQKGIHPRQFQFQPGEVTVRSVFHHLKTDEVTGEILEDWFVVVPQIRVCR